jgi:hypothetical protein
VQALFDHRRLIAVHTSVQLGYEAGGSAGARLSVDRRRAHDHAASIGEHLACRGGLTIDYLHVDGHQQLIECNPRTVEPGNAAHAGVGFPALTIALSSGALPGTGPLSGAPVFGHAAPWRLPSGPLNATAVARPCWPYCGTAPCLVATSEAGSRF